jgi:CDP-glucose 4,6-dehydratase
MDIMGLDSYFWSQQRILITGHTGFKGSWLSLLLKHQGSELFGLSNPPPTCPSLYQLAKTSSLLTDEFINDVTDYQSVEAAIKVIQPSIIFHLAAQPLVLESYRDPLTTFSSNVMGTANILQAARTCSSLKAIVVITTDKCYADNADGRPYQENDRLGGYDPYSASKACAEIVTSSFDRSFYQSQQKVNLATARAGNVIGGGDWAQDRLIPDCVRALESRKPITLRNPNSVRPWQHVLDPLRGYMLLVQYLCSENQQSLAWNFGPDINQRVTTKKIAEIARQTWGEGKIECEDGHPGLVETNVLRLDSTKAKDKLNWATLWDTKTAVTKTIEWYRSVHDGESALSASQRQIDNYLSKADQG